MLPFGWVEIVDSRTIPRGSLSFAQRNIGMQMAYSPFHADLHHSLIKTMKKQSTSLDEKGFDDDPVIAAVETPF